MPTLTHQSDRDDLAAAVRWAHRIGLHEGVLGHFRLAVPGPDDVLRYDRFLVHPLNILPEEASASELLLVDINGTALEGEGHMACPLWTPPAFMARSSRAWFHTHMPHATALAQLDDPTLLPIGQAALFMHGRVAYEPEYRGMGTHPPEEAAARVSAMIAEAPIVVMGGHGVVVTGPSAAEALYDLYLLETAARLQLLSMGTGAPLRTIPKDTIDLAVDEINVLRPRQAERYFTAAKRVLDSVRS